MSKFKDVTNQKFGRLTALYRLHDTNVRTKWLCICDCGNFAEVLLPNLTRGRTTSCGCRQKESVTKHHLAGSRLYNIYRNMYKRCYKSNSPNYKHYGARGIKICDEWLNNVQLFYNWAIDNGYQDDLSIDRIDVDGNYEPLNCRWVDLKTQNRNRRNIKNYTINGETHCLAEWCEILNLNYPTVYARIFDYHWPIEKALELL